MTLNYLDFIKFLKKNNLHLFDYQIRFAYDNLNKYIKEDSKYSNFIYKNNLLHGQNISILYELIDNKNYSLNFYF